MLICTTPGLREYWLAIWLASAALGGGLGFALVTRPASLRGLMLYGTPLRKFGLCLFPALFGGAVMTVVHWSSGNLHAIPGTWLLMYGCALISASVAATRTIGVMGGAFVGLGVLGWLGLADQWTRHWGPRVQISVEPGLQGRLGSSAPNLNGMRAPSLIELEVRVK